ncbi:sulfatase-like hydrolase/transferase [Calycomorphotria hydatis]|uniref:Arylsulfatase n=1 Tax=Calycomorphotria hydatis TaxID=2528027 RepID=A0A517T7I3_9PLAN|nr:sulfatase-like hydrolase/transferase [Calycomorphotria hydatis]QDT64329.1 Arylsulfatase [Calycomorphotria hydatis]
MTRALSLTLFVITGFAGFAIADDRPNIIFILTDDQRWDSTSYAGNEKINTPNLDRIAERGMRFRSGFVTLAICSPSRAACLTGRYNSANGVTTVGSRPFHKGEVTVAERLRDAGYHTGVTGKWHLGPTPKQCGFEFASTCHGNGTWYNRKFMIDGEARNMPGFVDDVVVDESIRFLREATKDDAPAYLWLCTQVPHMDHRHEWPAKPEFLKQHATADMPLPESWNDDYSSKPSYLLNARNHQQAMKYGYDDPAMIRKHAREYYASVEQMDRSIGRFLDELDTLGMRDNTWIILMGDNGWLLGEHAMTSKVIPYEESMRVPMVLASPEGVSKDVDEIVLHLDLVKTIYELAGLDDPGNLHGESLLPFFESDSPASWRSSFLYEVPKTQLGVRPLHAMRTERWKYIRTPLEDGMVFEELYDLEADSIEMRNLAGEAEQSETVAQLRDALSQAKAKIK